MRLLGPPLECKSGRQKVENNFIPGSFVGCQLHNDGDEWATLTAEHLGAADLWSLVT